ncbi:MAG: hypothetical protein U0528_21130 [Anaerolineae bacterium]
MVRYGSCGRAELLAGDAPHGKLRAANHAIIHELITNAVRFECLGHWSRNFAWVETHDDKDVIVHRKGTRSGR